MSALRSIVPAILVLVVGVALMAYESIHVINGSNLTGVNLDLLWVGLGVIVVGAILLVLSVAFSGEGPTSQPTDPGPAVDSASS